LTDILPAYRQARKRLLLLDYDGTLAPFVRDPSNAKPSDRVLSVLQRLTEDKRNTVAVISGREKKVLDDWLGHLRVKLIAEHGAFEKYGKEWQNVIRVNPSWKEVIRPIMHSFLPKIPGSLLEEKELSLVFHYRGGKKPIQAEEFAKSLEHKISPLLTKLGLNMTDDNLTIEVRQLGTDKGKTAITSLGHGVYSFVLCAGDAQTDEDMFLALEDKAFCIKVGPGKTAASYRVRDSSEFIELLEALA